MRKTFRMIIEIKEGVKTVNYFELYKIKISYEKSIPENDSTDQFWEELCEKLEERLKPFRQNIEEWLNSQMDLGFKVEIY